MPPSFSRTCSVRPSGKKALPMPSFRQAVLDLAQSQKARRGVSLYSRFINRPIGRLLAAAAFKTGMSPNSVTVASAIVTASGLLVLVTGPAGPIRAILAMLLLVLGFALDSADGQVARLTGTSSATGEWLDHVVDAGKIVAVHGAVLVAAYLHLSVDDAYYLVPLAFQVVAIVTFVGGLLVELLLKAKKQTTATPDTPSLARAVVLLPADYGILALSIGLFGWPAVFLPVYALLLSANAVIMVLLLAKWFRKLQTAAG